MYFTVLSEINVIPRRLPKLLKDKARKDKSRSLYYVKSQFISILMLD